MRLKNVCIAAASLLLQGGSPLLAKINVVTTTQDLATIASEIGGDHVNVTAIAKGYQDTHHVDAKPSFLLKMRRAALFIQVGLDHEEAWAPALLDGSRNSRILPGNPGFLDASAGCDILGIPQGKVDRSHGDVHPHGNPHYWLDPDNGAIIAKNIAGKLSKIDPGNAASYKANLGDFEKRLAAKRKEWMEIAKGLQGVKVVTYHDSWPNFAKRFGLNVINFVEPKPGVPPSPAHVKTLIDQIKREKARVILVETYYDLKLPNKIASETGAKVLVFPHSVGAIPQVQSYFDLFDHNLKTLSQALKEKP